MVHILGQKPKQNSGDQLNAIMGKLSQSIENVIATQGVSDPAGVDRWADSIAVGIGARIKELTEANDPSAGKSLAGITQFLGEYSIGAAQAAGNLVVDQNGMPILSATEEQKLIMAKVYAEATCLAICGIAMRIIDGEFRNRAIEIETKKAVANEQG
ncbi:MAG: hypothetical protein E6Q97_15735 [Desulfurellales bacterium]|nr:MAG: hypothetical protein E6Q97_15735 [Desulfurellales bacterium]